MPNGASSASWTRLPSSGACSVLAAVASGIWARTFLKDRVWERSGGRRPGALDHGNDGSRAVARPGHGRDIYNPAGSPELRAWERHLRAQGRSMPTDKHGGWYFPTRLPPLEASPCP